MAKPIPARRSADPHLPPPVPPTPGPNAPPLPWNKRPVVFLAGFVLILAAALALLALTDDREPEALSDAELRALMFAPEPPPPTANPISDRLAGLSLVSTPAGADLHLDGRWVGQTPLVLEGQRAGFYSLQVEAAGHAPRDTTFYLASGSFHQFNFRLLPAGARRPTDGSPDAPITLTERGRAGGGVAASPSRSRSTDTSVPAAAGALDFEVASADDVQQMTHTGSLSVSSNPPGATVFVDGVPFGQTPLALQGLRPGSYVVTLSAPGFDPLTFQAEVEARSVAVVKGAFPHAP